MDKKILVIEDNSYEIVLIKHTIEAVWKGEIDVATSAEEAREKLSTEDASKIELIILDLNLPGTGGLDFLMELHSNYPTIPVIIATGSRRREDVLQAIRIGAFDFVEKPLTQERLQSCLIKIEKSKHERFMVSVIDEDKKVKSLNDIEKEIIQKALEFHDNNISKASSALGITRATLYKKIE